MDPLPVTRRTFLLAAPLGILGCVDASPPVHFVPLRPGIAADPLALAADALTRCGFTVAQRDDASGRIVSEWNFDASFAGTRRRRAELRFQPGAPAGFALAVPIQLRSGERWMYAGEDEELRRRIVATLLARMQAGR